MGKLGHFQKPLRHIDTFNQLFVNQGQIFFFFVFVAAVLKIFVKQAFGNHANGAEVVFHFVSNRGGQKTQRREFLLVRKTDIFT